MKKNIKKDEMTINFGKMQVFFLLCEKQSFSLAAKELGVHQSYISRSIKELEKFIKQRLIANTQKPIILTKYGKILYEISKKINVEMGHVEENLLYHRKLYRNPHVKIFLSIPIIAGLLLTHKLKIFFQSIPELGFDFSFANIVTMESLNQHDMAITKEHVEHVLIDTEYINKYEMCFGISKEYFNQHGYPQDASSLILHNFLFIEDNFYDQVVPPSVRNYMSKKYMVENEMASYKAIEDGAGIGIIPKFMSYYFEKIITFDLREKLQKLPLFVAVSKVKKNCYTNLISEFLKQGLTEVRSYLTTDYDSECIAKSANEDRTILYYDKN